METARLEELPAEISGPWIVSRQLACEIKTDAQGSEMKKFFKKHGKDLALEDQYFCIEETCLALARRPARLGGCALSSLRSLSEPEHHGEAQGDARPAQEVAALRGC